MGVGEAFFFFFFCLHVSFKSLRPYFLQFFLQRHISSPVNEFLPGFPGGSDGKESACNAGDLGSIPGLGRSPEGGHGNPLQYSHLENPMDRGAWQTTVHSVLKNQTRLSN